MVGSRWGSSAVLGTVCALVLGVGCSTGARTAEGATTTVLATSSSTSSSTGPTTITTPAGGPSTAAVPSSTTEPTETPSPPPDGSAPGLSAELAHPERAAAVLGALDVRGRGPKTGYDREAFGPRWSDDNGDPVFGHNGCDTRNDVLHRDLSGIEVRPGTRDCVVVAGTLVEPYTGRPTTFAKARAAELPIDHVVPLSYAWQLGAAGWTPERRQDFANDPLNLLVADRSANEQKGDSGPASWLPPNKPIRCAYVVRFAEVAEKYDLPITPADRQVAQDRCRVPG